MHHLEYEAKKNLEPSVYDYIAGVRSHQNSFDQYQLIPRMLQDIEKVDTSLTILNHHLALPVIIGPSAFHQLTTPEGELATARASAIANTIMTLSTMSTVALEEVANCTDAPKWFQLYIHKNRAITEDLIQRAEMAGYTAFVLTVDVPVMGIELRRLRNNLVIPPHIKAANFRGSTLSILSGSKITNENNADLEINVTWRIIDWLRSKTRLPIFLKGILHPEDAVEALNYEISGIIVSNHGGRQLKSVIAAIDALPSIVNLLKNRMPVLMDGSVRSGEDIVKAISLGAHGVMIARSVMWALAVDGMTGVLSLLQTLQEELAITLRLCGFSSLESLRQNGAALIKKI